MKFSLRTYAAYSIGWAAGWSSATIARAVYPPHEARQTVEIDR
jgi:hypothetical protein